MSKATCNNIFVLIEQRTFILTAICQLPFEHSGGHKMNWKQLGVENPEYATIRWENMYHGDRIP